MKTPPEIVEIESPILQIVIQICPLLKKSIENQEVVNPTFLYPLISELMKKILQSKTQKSPDDKIEEFNYEKSIENLKDEIWMMLRDHCQLRDDEESKSRIISLIEGAEAGLSWKSIETGLKEKEESSEIEDLDLAIGNYKIYQVSFAGERDYLIAIPQEYPFKLFLKNLHFGNYIVSGTKLSFLITLGKTSLFLRPDGMIRTEIRLLPVEEVQKIIADLMNTVKILQKT